MEIMISGFADYMYVGPKKIETKSGDYRKLVEEHSPFRVLNGRDGGWGGSRIFMLQNKESGVVFECTGYHSTHGTLTIHTENIVTDTPDREKLTHISLTGPLAGTILCGKNRERFSKVERAAHPGKWIDETWGAIKCEQCLKLWNEEEKQS